jgi:hypothetical protein
MMLKIMAYSLAAMLVLFSSTLLAEVGAYQIELIVFSQAIPTTEVFEQSSSQISWPSALTELSAYKKPDNTTLADSYSALSKDSAYRPISHIAWIQPVAEGGLIAPVHIQSTDGKLNGYLQMQQEQGLHMMVDFELASNPGEMIYRLTEKRQVKLNEVYYLDHPKFGIVVKISPF